MSKNKHEKYSTYYRDGYKSEEVDEVETAGTEVVSEATETEAVSEPTEKKLTFPTRGRVYAEGFKSVRIREEPDVNAKIITEVPVGQDVTLGDTVNGWTKVCWIHLEGWMMDKYIARYR